jgi:glycosyltransferase involved in cell wall biosynthesis
MSLLSSSATSSTMQIRRALKDQNFDAVFVHTDGELLMASSALRLGRGAGRVVRRVPPYAPVIEGRGARFATKIAPTGLLFSTDGDRSRVVDTGHRLPAMLAPLAVNLSDHDRIQAAKSLLGAPANAVLMACVHDGDDQRQVLNLLRTLAVLSSRHPELHLVIVGEAQQEELRLKGAALGVNARVTYLGARDDELSILRAADVGWIAADGDAAAFAALDFMSFGTPVIAERSPLTEHYVADGIAGVLLPRPESAADMARVVAAVTAFLGKRDQRVAMGRAARARLEREFDFEEMIRGYEGAVSPAARPAARTVA